MPRDFFACGENAHGGLYHKRFASLRVYDKIAISAPRAAGGGIKAGGSWHGD
jgi:hypothetical protein